jgi:hypothetical protein
MVNKKNWLGTLVMVLVFGMTVVGCSNDVTSGGTTGGGTGTTGGGTDTWIDVTSFSQVNGSWKAQSPYSFTQDGITYSSTYNNYIITFNATQKTMSQSGSSTVTLSGENINSVWADFKSGFQDSINEAELPPGLTITFNDANHSFTITCNNISVTSTDEDLSRDGMEINQYGTKLKMADATGTEFILTKL